MRRYSKRSLGNLKGIHPDLRRVIDRALQQSPYDFIVIEGLRTMQRQRELVANGDSTTMNSRHLTGHAVDLLPVGPNGPAFAWPLYDRLGPAVKAAAEADARVRLVQFRIKRVKGSSRIVAHLRPARGLRKRR